MATTISHFPMDLIVEILTTAPLKSMRAVRSTCKMWNTLSTNRSFSKMIAMMNYNLYSMSVDVDGIDPSTELKSKLTFLNKQVKISQVFHCEGLLLCILKDDNTKVMVWNPYCWQTRLIELRFYPIGVGWDRFSYALGYENKKSCRSFKFLRFIDYYYRIRPEKQIIWYEIYDFDSDSWTTLDVSPHWRIIFYHHGISLKGNTYWCARERNSAGTIDHIICFDFTRESFGPLLPLPSNAVDHKYTYLSLCCVREEKIAALFQHHKPFKNELEIWITTKIEDKTVSWSKFLRIDTGPADVTVPLIFGGFFIDEEKKVAWVLIDLNVENLSSLERMDMLENWIWEKMSTEIVDHKCVLMFQVWFRSRNLLH